MTEPLSDRLTDNALVERIARAIVRSIMTEACTAASEETIEAIASDDWKTWEHQARALLPIIEAERADAIATLSARITELERQVAEYAEIERKE